MANQELNDLYQNSNSVFYFLRSMKEEETDDWRASKENLPREEGSMSR